MVITQTDPSKANNKNNPTAQDWDMTGVLSGSSEQNQSQLELQNNAAAEKWVDSTTKLLDLAHDKANRVDTINDQVVISVNPDATYLLLAHTPDYFKGDPTRRADAGTPEFWNDPTQTNRNISLTTLFDELGSFNVDPRNLKDSILFGFEEIKPDDIRYTGFAAEHGTPMKEEITRDHEPFFEGDNNELMDPIDFKEKALNTLKNTGNPGLPEIVVPRFQQGKARQPDYLIVFDGQIGEKTLQLAKKYVVPIVNLPSKYQQPDVNP
jgi:hypothetical protein